MKNQNLCQYCDPYPVGRNHFQDKLENFFSPLAIIFEPFEWLFQKFPKIQAFLYKVTIGSLFKILLWLKILQEVEAEDSDQQLSNRSLVVVREARKRGISINAIKLFGKGTNHFSIKFQGKKKIFEGLPNLTLEYASVLNIDDKRKIKELLQKEKLPHPRGSVFKSFSSARQYVSDTIGFPVVVKPRFGSLSRHTICNITNGRQLKDAIDIAKIICTEFIVEEFIPGDIHRITLVDDQFVASCLREQANVIGDGKNSIEELIRIKNQNPLRGEIFQRNFTLHKLIITEKTKTLLASENLNLNSILPNGRKVYLNDKVILACGADIHDTTDQIHPENINLFKKVSRLCKSPLIGIDFIAQDISKPYFEQKCGILEVNSIPYIDMHHYPVTGKARNVAGSLLDYCCLASESDD